MQRPNTWQTLHEEIPRPESGEAAYDALGHEAPKIACDMCVLRSHTPPAAGQHMKDQNHHWSYCRDCDKRFQNENDFKMVSISPPTPQRGRKGDNLSAFGAEKVLENIPLSQKAPKATFRPYTVIFCCAALRVKVHSGGSWH